jgi:flavin-dependent dehydrogenase
MSANITDVLVIGGGPAGSAAGTFLRQRGHSVTLLEKDSHPRFHIGESLLPMNLPILERMGVLSDVEAIGVTKYGADFTETSAGAECQTFRFGEALGNSPDHAFEVRRADFDRVLFEHCKKSGVNAIEGVRVVGAEALDNGHHRVVAVDSENVEHSWEARFLVDASGRETFLSSAKKWKKRNPRHASAAVFTHFKGVERRPGRDQGNISLYWFDHGWIWMIPLEQDVMSIGAVCKPGYLKSRKESLEVFLQQTLKSIPEVRDRIASAEQMLPVQATGNYSYLSRRMHGPGFVMVGDAYAFIDPVFSSGVYLAMNSAEMACEPIDAWLRGDRWAYRREMRRYEHRINRGISSFSWFIYRFTTPGMRLLMSQPRNVLKVVQAVISMLAGDVFDNREVQRRLWVFKSFYSVATVVAWARRHRSTAAP